MNVGQSSSMARTEMKVVLVKTTQVKREERSSGGGALRRPK